MCVRKPDRNGHQPVRIQARSVQVLSDEFRLSRNLKVTIGDRPFSVLSIDAGRAAQRRISRGNSTEAGRPIYVGGAVAGFGNRLDQPGALKILDSEPGQ